MDSLSTDLIAMSCGNDVLRRSIAGALQGQGRNVELEVVAAAGTPFDFTRCVAAILVHPDVTHDAADAGAGYQAIREAAVRSRCRLIEVVPAAARPAAASVLLRTAPVYGIGTDPLTTLFIMMRTLPAIPVLSTRSSARPVWHRDLAAAIAAAVDSAAGDAVVCDLSGPDAVTPDELYDRIARLINRHPLRVPIPEFLATPALKLAASLNVVPAFVDGLQAMFATPPGGAAPAAPPDGCAPAPTGIEEGLRLLIAELEELTPADGIGAVEVKRFSSTIRGADCDAIALMRLFTTQFSEIMPIPVGVEPASPEVVLRPGADITMTLPGRGHVQVRVREVASRRVTLATVRGHALAGIVRFSARDLDDGLEFEVMTCDAAANRLDWLTLTMGGARLQDANWSTVVERVAQRAGGTHDAVQSDNRTLGDEEAAAVERWVNEIAGGPGR
jgi:NADH dehydrogenase